MLFVSPFFTYMSSPGIANLENSEGGISVERGYCGFSAEGGNNLLKKFGSLILALFRP